MSWSYSGDPLTSDMDMVRFKIGDTDVDSPQFTDAEILALLSGSTVNAAAASAAEQLASKYSRMVDKRIGDLSISYSQLAKSYVDLAKRLRAGSTLPSPYAGGISIADKETDQDNSDSVRPAFSRDQHSPPGSSNDNGISWWRE